MALKDFVVKQGLVVGQDAEINGTGSVKVPAGTTEQRPGTPASGMLRYNTTLSSLEQYDGSNWNKVGNALVTISDTAPQSPVQNDLWWDSTDANLFIYYNGAWVEASYNIGTNLGLTSTSSSVTITSSTGDDVTIPSANSTVAGLLSASDKTTLDSLTSGANTLPTDLTYSSNATSVTIASSTGNDAIIPSANATVAGVITSADKSTLDTLAASPAASITSTDTTNWNTAYGWGDHSTEGYLTSYTETDPVFSASPSANITSADITNWDTAYSWGDHANSGYITGAVEDVFWENSQNLNTSYTLVTGRSAVSAGPITVAEGQTVTLETGAKWTIV